MRFLIPGVLILCMGDCEFARVKRTWTAPGDDGRKGKAAVYQIRYATKPILEFVPWPEKQGTHIAFWGAENVSDEPEPTPAGTRQAHTVKGLQPETYWFAAKARDETGRQSAISNVVKLEVK